MTPGLNSVSLVQVPSEKAGVHDIINSQDKTDGYPFHLKERTPSSSPADTVVLRILTAQTENHGQDAFPSYSVIGKFVPSGATRAAMRLQPCRDGSGNHVSCSLPMQLTARQLSSRKRCGAVLRTRLCLPGLLLFIPYYLGRYVFCLSAPRSSTQY